MHGRAARNVAGWSTVAAGSQGRVAERWTGWLTGFVDWTVRRYIRRNMPDQADRIHAIQPRQALPSRPLDEWFTSIDPTQAALAGCAHEV
jgi:hypothetical protein